MSEVGIKNLKLKATEIEEPLSRQRDQKYSLDMQGD